MTWNFNMDECPKSYFVEEEITDSLGRKMIKQTVVEVKVLLADADSDFVTVSRWLPKEKGWNMFTDKQTPLAWMPFPEHPNKGN
jgi:hypothetical protein